jgi:hypothetical protein
LPAPPIRGDFNFTIVFTCTLILFFYLTFLVVDANVLEQGFILQLTKNETFWPDSTFNRFGYTIVRVRPANESSLADYWSILFIGKLTDAVEKLIYYPFIILSLLLVARLSYFGNWTFTPALVLTLCLHFSLALYAGWQLPKKAREYQDQVLGRLNRRRRQALLLSQEERADAYNHMIDAVQSNHDGRFAYLWEQPAIRAILLPPGGLGLVTLLQYLVQAQILR